MTNGNFRRDVQGLRGVAVLLVVLYHAGTPLHGGFIGVDVFFVISGFVIGASLLGELQATGRISLSRFYARRIRRLLPALAAMLLFVSTVGLLFAPVGSAQVTTRTAVAASSFLANVYLSLVGDGYFAPAAEWNPLLHTWSLSVEEQFYLVFPVLIGVAFVVGRRCGRPLVAVMSILVVVGVGSFAMSELWLAGKLEFGAPADRLAFFMMPSRAWEFIAGLLLAVLVRSRRWRPAPPIVAGLAGLVGAVAVVASAVMLSSGSRFPGWSALPTVVGTVLLIVGGTDAASRTHQVLAWRPLVYLGDVSYSWYLWHWPLIVFARALWPLASPMVTGLVAAMVSLPVAHGAYRLIEKPIRRAPRWQGRKVVALGAACVSLPVLAAQSLALIEGRIPSGDYGHTMRRDLTDSSECDGPTPLGERVSGACIWGSPDATRTALLIGDSNARQFAEAAVLATVGTDWQVEIITMSACPFIAADFRWDGITRNECRRFVSESVEALASQPRDLVVISLTERYLGFLDLEIRRENGSWSGVGADRDRLFAGAFSSALERVRAGGSEVVVVQPVPKPVGFDPRQCARLLWLVDGGCWSSASRSEVIAQSERAWSAISEAAQRSDVAVLDLFDELCPGDPCRTERNGESLYRDYGHISVAASESLAPQFAKLFESFER